MIQQMRTLSLPSLSLSLQNDSPNELTQISYGLRKLTATVSSLAAVEFAAQHGAPLELHVRAVGAPDVEARVAVRHPPLVVGPQHQAVGAVIVVVAAEAGEQLFRRTVGLQVAVLVFDRPTGRGSWRRRLCRRPRRCSSAQNRPSAEDGDLVGLAVAVGVFSTLILSAGGFFGAAAIPLDFGHPHAAVRVDVDRRRVGDHRLGGEQRDLEIRFGPQAGEFVFRRRCAQRGSREDQ